jgi:acylphosphatase
MSHGFSAIVHGRVQGVGFRYFVKTKAEVLGIKGWVRNLPDETVEVMAIGPLEALEQLLHVIRSGPIGSRVKDVDFQWFQDLMEFEGFEIKG